MEGYLTKFAVSGRFKSWKQRYIVLYPEGISWMDRPDSPVSSAKMFPLNKSTKVSMTKEGHLQILNEEGTKLLLRTSDSENVQGGTYLFANT